MRPTAFPAAMAAALAATSTMAEVDWIWDTSGRTEHSPSTAVAAISTALPLTVPVANANQTDTFTPNWLDSEGFDLDGLPAGTMVILR